MDESQESPVHTIEGKEKQGLAAHWLQGGSGLVKCQLLHDRRTLLTEDVRGQVDSWDVVQVIHRKARVRSLL